jgi:hypothetical protein
MHVSESAMIDAFKRDRDKVVDMLRQVLPGCGKYNPPLLKRFVVEPLKHVDECFIEIEEHGLTLQIDEMDISTIAGKKYHPCWTVLETRCTPGGHWEPDDYDLYELSSHRSYPEAIAKVLLVIAEREIDGVMQSYADGKHAEEVESWPDDK